MQVNITARHCNVPKKVRLEAEQKLQRLHRYEPRVANVVVEFDNDHGSKQVATRVHLAGNHSIIATGIGETYHTALGQSLERLTRQLKRARERIRDHKAPKLSEANAAKVMVRENTHD